jgi:hypothetical protein
MIAYLLTFAAGVGVGVIGVFVWAGYEVHV